MKNLLNRNVPDGFIPFNGSNDYKNKPVKKLLKSKRARVLYSYRVIRNFSISWVLKTG